MNEETQSYRRKSRAKSHTETPFMSKILMLRLVCAAVIICILFFVSRTGGKISENISEFYSTAKQKDMSVFEVAETFKNTAKETFVPIKDVPKTEDLTKTGESETASPDIF